MLQFKINLYVCQYMFGITLNKTYMYASTILLQINLINTSTICVGHDLNWCSWWWYVCSVYVE